MPTEKPKTIEEFVLRYSCRLGDDYRLIYHRHPWGDKQQWITLEDFAHAVAEFVVGEMKDAVCQENDGGCPLPPEEECRSCSKIRKKAKALGLEPERSGM